MGVTLGFVMAVMLAGEKQTPARLDEVFARWAEAEKGCRSLVVEFAITQSHNVIKRDMVTTGILRLARTDGGEVVAGCEFIRTDNGRTFRQQALVSEGRVYLLDPERKTAVRWENMEGGAAGFVERNFLPFVLLLDREQAEQKCRVAVIKEDKDFTYLTVTPRTVRTTGWLPDNFHDGRMAVTRTASEAIPAGRPRQLWCTDGDHQTWFDITAWRENPTDGPTAKEFIRPEDREGWTVTDAPFQSQRDAKKDTGVVGKVDKTKPEGDTGKASKATPEATGCLTAKWPTDLEGPKFVLVSLYRDGELLRSRELEPFDVRCKHRVTWKNLPSGVYEVCFEAKGYGRGVKRVRVSPEDEDELEVHIELDRGDYRLGDGLRAKAGSK